MNKQRRQISDGKRERIFAMTAGACYYCGYAADCLDHIVPYSYSANDTDDNLVAACSICNGIASNRHFNNLQAKKEYILAERDTPHWKNKLARMVVTVIQPPATGMPPAEPEARPLRRDKKFKPFSFDNPGDQPKPIKRTSRPQPEPVKRAAPEITAPAATYEYLEDRPDYTNILVDDLIDYIDDLTDEDGDRLMDALISHGMYKRLFSEVGDFAKLDRAERQAFNNRPVVYGRNQHGQIERIVL